MASRPERFDDLVIEAASRVERSWGRPLPPFELGVERVPPSDPAPWEHSEVPLGRFFPPQGRQPARIVVYRRPIETRVDGVRELAALIGDVVTEQLAALLGVNPEDLDADYGQDD